MLYETLLQGQIFLGMFYFGLIAGIFLEAKNLLDKIFKNKIFIAITDFSFLLISSFLFILSENLFNYGEFRLFLLIAFVLAVYLEHKTIGYLVEKFFILAYNFINKLYTKFLNKIKKRFKKYDRKTNGNSIKSN